jgi:hypothetical protein
MPPGRAARSSGYREGLREDIEGRVAPYTGCRGQIEVRDPLVGTRVVVDPSIDEMGQHQPRRVTARIDERDALPPLDQGDREVRQEPALAAIGRPGDVHMARQVRHGKADRDAQEWRPERAEGEMVRVVAIQHRSENKRRMNNAHCHASEITGP